MGPVSTKSLAGSTRSHKRRLIVNADDFGRSASINRAVIHAYQEGILTTASLMVTGSAFEDAVKLAKANPGLGVGLHLTLLCGRSSLKPTEVPGLVDKSYAFTNSPLLAGLRYYFIPSLRSQLMKEIHAQFEKFKRTGLKLDHVNGHLHMHLHPTVFDILTQNLQDWNITHMRLTRDRFWLNLRLASGRWIYRTSHAVIFNALSAMARPSVQENSVKTTQNVFGLLQDSHVDEYYISRLIPFLPEGDSELYSHPCTEKFKHEYEALISPRIKSLVEEHNVELIRYQDL